MTSASKLRVLVVDDEAPARRKVLRVLRQEPDVQVVGEAAVSYTHLTLPTTPYV